MRVCILNGVHTPGSDWEKECPVLRARRRQESANGGAGGVVAGSPQAPPSTPDSSTTSTTILRRVRNGRAFSPGRPRVPAAVQREKARERDRVYRQRRVAAQAAANAALLVGGR
jgi:hypothetical protein